MWQVILLKHIMWPATRVLQVRHVHSSQIAVGSHIL